MLTLRILRPGNGSTHPLRSSISHQLPDNQLSQQLVTSIKNSNRWDLLWRIHTRTFRPVFGLFPVKDSFILLFQLDIKLSFIIRHFWLLKRAYTCETNTFWRVLRDIDLTLTKWATFPDGFDAVNERTVRFSLKGKPAGYILENMVSKSVDDTYPKQSKIRRLWNWLSTIRTKPKKL